MKYAEAKSSRNKGVVDARDWVGPDGGIVGSQDGAHLPRDRCHQQPNTDDKLENDGRVRPPIEWQNVVQSDQGRRRDRSAKQTSHDEPPTPTRCQILGRSHLPTLTLCHGVASAAPGRS